MVPEDQKTSRPCSSSSVGRITNDFCITCATVNGSGSATANNTILRSLFRMGIPVSGKNIFPSNIQGLSTWYTIRLNKDGFLSRVEFDDVVVAMNATSFVKDMAKLVPGGALFYADDIKTPITREDIVAYPMPVKKLTKESDVAPNMRDYVANMVYVGVLAQMIGISMDEIYKSLDHHFKGKAKPVQANFNVVKAAADWAAVNLEKSDPYWVEPMPPLAGYIMADGNTAGALGSIYGGVQFAAWYPITPASSLAESLVEYLPSLRKEPLTGKDTYAVVQAEDELAAVGMAVGAGWGGLRAMTSTSGPGFSLMTEYAGLANLAEIPLVIWDVQRVGPSTGMPTRTAQGDLTFANFMGHGDTRYVILLPGSVTECFEFGWRSFDLAERLQSPVLVLSDLDLGMNQWMTKRFDYPDTPMDRGKILWEEDLDQLNGNWARYKDVDGDGIPYRTVPGNRHQHAAFFTRGTGHDENAAYSEDNKVWENNLLRIKRKFETARTLVPKPIVQLQPGARLGIISMGSTDPAIEEARFCLNRDGVPTDYMRIRSLPFSPEVSDFIFSHDHHYVVEMNRDGQLHQLLSLEFQDCSVSLISAAHTDGLPLTSQWIIAQITSHEEKRS